MDTKCFQGELSWARLFLLLILTSLLTSTLHSQTQRYSDDQLVSIGQDVYRKGDYAAASLFLFAYIQKNPELMSTDAEFAAEVQKAYQYSLDQVRSALSERDRLKVQVAAQAHDGIGSTTSGLHEAPPPLNIPRKPPKTTVP
jgi:hypothetical protein